MKKRKRDDRDILYEFQHSSYSNMFHIFEHEMTKAQRKQACTKLHSWHGVAITELVKKQEFDTITYLHEKWKWNIESAWCDILYHNGMDPMPFWNIT
jgi:hypothetical protein